MASPDLSPLGELVERWITARDHVKPYPLNPTKGYKILKLNSKKVKCGLR
jgi:hypothetical protein